jgi:hypothetical protein
MVDRQPNDPAGTRAATREKQRLVSLETRGASSTRPSVP